MSDRISHLQELIIDFREQRDWKQFHKIKDLLLGLSIEVSELEQLFLWKSEAEIEEIDRVKIEHEVADIFTMLIYICQEYEIDLAQAVRDKMELNIQKYPVEKSRGSNKKYTELD